MTKRTSPAHSNSTSAWERGGGPWRHRPGRSDFEYLQHWVPPGDERIHGSSDAWGGAVGTANVAVIRTIAGNAIGTAGGPGSRACWPDALG